mmetsp:Transcript_11543/g.27940  ORF Transcript_11543/g.27940 Transcript_11543/m.27940 type:complete len:116 (+) Transcript_11543:993-1340(+)
MMMICLEMCLISISMMINCDECIEKQHHKNPNTTKGSPTAATTLPGHCSSMILLYNRKEIRSKSGGNKILSRPTRRTPFWAKGTVRTVLLLATNGHQFRPQPWIEQLLSCFHQTP